MNATHVETFIIGAGFAGMGAALYLTEQNSSVALCEMLKYPGGCAGTFHKGEFAFEAGATLFSGFHERGLFRKWVDKYELPVQFHSEPKTGLYRSHQIDRSP